MGNQVISLNEALQEMDKRDRNDKILPVDLIVKTFSSAKRTGGSTKEYSNVKCFPIAKTSRKKSITVKNILDPVKAIKNPNHFENYTRSIELPDGSIKRINIIFIISVNGKKVIY